MQAWVQSMVPDTAWPWVSAHAGHGAAAIALALLAFMLVSLVSDALPKYTGVMLTAICLRAVVTWKARRQGAPPLPRPGGTKHYQMRMLRGGR